MRQYSERPDAVSSSGPTPRLHGMAAVPLNPVQTHRSRGLPLPIDEVQQMVEQVDRYSKGFLLKKEKKKKANLNTPSPTHIVFLRW
jgi:hypothetical protein